MKIVHLLIIGIIVGGGWACNAFGCAQGYESPESLLKRARLILELEPVSVADVPEPVNGQEPFSECDMPMERSNAVAIVNVTAVLKGTCGVKSFKLIGGPYDTCAPFASYVHFEAGKRILLILDRDLPDGTTTIVVTWRCRISPVDRKELAVLTNRNQNAWIKMLDLHRKTSPEAFNEAKRLLSGTGSPQKIPALKGKSYPVLACIRILMMNPADVPPLSPNKPADNKGSISSSHGEPRKDLTNGIYYTDQYNNFPLPGELTEMLGSKGKADPAAVREFNKVLFGVFLKDELFLGDTAIRNIITAKELADPLSEVGFSPYKCRIRTRSETPDRTLRSLPYLIALADDESDALVWQTFGLNDDPGLNADMFASYVERNMDSDYSMWPKLQLLLVLPHPQIAPIIRKALEQEQNMYRLDQYCRFFTAIRDGDYTQKVLAKFQALAFDADSSKWTDEQQQSHRESVLYLIGKFKEVLSKSAYSDEKVVNTMASLDKKARDLYPRTERSKPEQNLGGDSQEIMPQD